MSDSSLRFRPARVSDIEPHILPIENRSYPRPWTHEVFRKELSNDVSRVDLVEREGAVIGYIVHWRVVDELHILNVSVSPEHRGQGVGAALLQHALEFARSRDCTYATLEVRVSNESAIHLYRKFRFEEIGRRGRYYADNGEDALIMGVLLG